MSTDQTQEVVVTIQLQRALGEGTENSLASLETDEKTTAGKWWTFAMDLSVGPGL